MTAYKRDSTDESISMAGHSHYSPAPNSNPQSTGNAAPQASPMHLAPHDEHGRPQVDLISIREVQQILGVKRTFVMKRVANKEMPLPIKFGSTRRAAVRWIRHEIIDYVMALAAKREQPSCTNEDPRSTA
jgi:predicted DNA-binding transcriptional regulator AlpA